MKFTVKTAEINKAFKNISRILKTTINDNSASINTEKDKIIISASYENDLLSFIVPAKIYEEGNIKVERKIITEFLNQLEMDETEISFKDKTVNIKNGEINANLPISNNYLAEAFKQKLDEFLTIKIDAKSLNNLLKRSIPFCGKDVTNKFNICITLADKIYTKTTDSHAASIIKTENKHKTNGEIVISLKEAMMLENLTRYATIKDEAVTIKTNKNKAILETTNLIAHFPIEEKYKFPIEDAINKAKKENSLIIDKENLLKTVQRMKCFINPNVETTPLYLNFRKDNVTTMIDSAYGQNTEKISYIQKPENECEIGMDIQYLTETLMNNELDEIVKIYVNNQNTPIVFGFEDAEYLIAPLRIQSKINLSVV